MNNLFIVDTGVIMTGGAVNPTLTIAALALRTADHILKKGIAGLFFQSKVQKTLAVPAESVATIGYHREGG